MTNNNDSNRAYVLFYSFFLIPLMITVFGTLFFLLFNVITFEPTDINQLLLKMENGSRHDKAEASLRINNLFYEDQTIYNSSYEEKIKKIHRLSKITEDEALRLHTIMIMGNSRDTIFGPLLIEELDAGKEDYRVKAIESLGKIRYTPSAGQILKFIHGNRTYYERLAAVGTLGNIGDPIAIFPLLEVINSDYIYLTDSGPNILYDACLALLKLNYSNKEVEKVINQLLDRKFYNKFSDSLHENNVNMIIVKVLTIISSLNNFDITEPYINNIEILAEKEQNLEIRNLAMKVIEKIRH